MNFNHLDTTKQNLKRKSILDQLTSALDDCIGQNYLLLSDQTNKKNDNRSRRYTNKSNIIITIDLNRRIKNKPVLEAFTLLCIGSQKQNMVQNCLIEAKTKAKPNDSST